MNLGWLVHLRFVLFAVKEKRFFRGLILARSCAGNVFAIRLRRK